jgi:hypothetical protein
MPRASGGGATPLRPAPPTWAGLPAAAAPPLLLGQPEQAPLQPPCACLGGPGRRAVLLPVLPAVRQGQGLCGGVLRVYQSQTGWAAAAQPSSPAGLSRAGARHAHRGWLVDWLAAAKEQSWGWQLWGRCVRQESELR